MYVRVVLRGEGEIVHAETREPAPDNVHEVQDEPNSRQWWTSVQGKDLNLQVAICVATKKNASVTTLKNLELKYWFEKE